MSTGLKANSDGSAAIQVGGSDAIQLTTGLAATFVNNVSVAGTASITGATSVTGNLSFNSGYGSSAVAYGCRAWVNFNGTGTVAIRASGNVTSITDNGTGDYTVNFTTAMPDVNYAVTGTQAGINDASGSNPVQGPATVDYATGSFRVYSGSNTTTKDDSIRVCLAVFR